MLKTCSTLSELDNDTISNICKAVSEDTGQSVAEVAATRLKLVCFWIRHQYRISREINMTSKALVCVEFKGTISLLQQQKRDEDTWTSENKEPEYTPLTLDTSYATKVFDKVKNLLARVCGVTGAPLVYVIRILIIPEDENNNPLFGDKDTKYTSVDMEATAHAPILSDDADYKEEYETLEAHEPFVPSFLTDTKKVWSILLACVVLASQARGNTPNRMGIKHTQQNGHQAWRTHHNHFFGWGKVNTMVSDILPTLKSLLHYSGDRKNFNFDKYCTAHVEQHNYHASLAKYGVAPLEETMKIHYFEDRISDSSFASIKSTIMVYRQKFQEFDAVM
jgi:hypothetical protein